MQVCKDCGADIFTRATSRLNPNVTVFECMSCGSQDMETKTMFVGLKDDTTWMVDEARRFKRRWDGDWRTELERLIEEWSNEFDRNARGL